MSINYGYKLNERFAFLLFLTAFFDKFSGLRNIWRRSVGLLDSVVASPKKQRKLLKKTMYSCTPSVFISLRLSDCAFVEMQQVLAELRDDGSSAGISVFKGVGDVAQGVPYSGVLKIETFYSITARHRVEYA